MRKKRASFLQSWLFDVQSRTSVELKKMVFLVPKPLINLLLLNPNNLTHWSRECPICLLGGSVSFSAAEDSVIRDGRRGGRWNEDIRCNQIFSLRGHGWGNQEPSRKSSAPKEQTFIYVRTQVQAISLSRLWLHSDCNSFGKHFLSVPSEGNPLWSSTSYLVPDNYKGTLLYICHSVKPLNRPLMMVLLSYFIDKEREAERSASSSRSQG